MRSVLVRRLRTLAIVLAVLLVAYASRMHTLPAMGAWLDVGQDPQPSDYAMVLNGDWETRPFAAADLYQRGLAKRIVITSSRAKQRPTAQPEPHEAVRRILLRCGIRQSDIEFIDARCRSTFDEARTLKDFLSNQPGLTASVITNDYHTRRTRWAFRTVLGPQASQVRFVSAKTDQFSASNWWQHEDGFVWYLSEFLKFTFYWFRYGRGFAWITAVLAIIGVGWHLRRRRLIKIASS